MSRGSLCPACGREIEHERIDVRTWADPDPSYMPGRAYCPNGCDPRFRRIVVARDYRTFRIICRENGWVHERIIFVRPDTPNSDASLRGVMIHPDMITFETEPGPRLRSMITAGASRYASGAGSIPFPPVPDAEPEPRPYIVPELWDEAEELISVINPGAFARTLPPDDRWGDSMRWVPSPDGEEPSYI